MWDGRVDMSVISIKIHEWNQNALELFRISQPNENMEFFGVIRFYFYGPNDKYYSKCVRISSQATARHLVNVLVEKFHPDLKLLKSGRYALYEYHPATGERRLGADEHPLMNQINWTTDHKEGRFLLRDELLLTNGNSNKFQSQPQSIDQMSKWRSAGNLINGGSERARSSSLKHPVSPLEISVQEFGSTDELFFPVNGIPENGTKKKWANTASRGEKNKKKQQQQQKSTNKKSKNRSDSDGGGPGAPVIRTSSLPNFLDEEGAFSTAARQKDISNGVLTIYLDPNFPDTLRQLKSSSTETANQIVNRILDIYGKQNSRHSVSYYLEQINHTSDNERLPFSVPRKRNLRPNERPLQLICDLSTRFPSIKTELHLTKMPEESLSIADGYDSQSPLHQPQYANLPAKLRNPSTERYQKSAPTFRLVEVNPDGSSKIGAVHFVLKGLIAPETDRQKGGTPIKIGSQFNSVGPPPNILVDAKLFPDIRPVHCSLLPASATHMTSGDRASVLLSPALDISIRPPGPTSVQLDGQKVDRPTPLRHGSVIQLGRSLFLRFLEPKESIYGSNPSLYSGRIPSGSNHDLRSMGNASSTHDLRSIGNGSSRDLRFGSRSPINGVKSAARSLDKEYRSRQSTSNLMLNNDQLLTDQLPIVVDICLPEAGRRSTHSKDDFAALFHESCCDTIDAILEVARSLSDHSTSLIGDLKANRSRAPLFVLSPAFLIYAVLRSCLRRWKAVQLTNEQKDFYLVGLINHIGNQMFQCIQTPFESSNGRSSLRTTINQLFFWLANASELLNFLKNDEDLSNGFDPSVMERCVGSAFRELRHTVLEFIKYLFPAVLFPGDFDLQDDIRLDMRPSISEIPSSSSEASIQRLLQTLSYLMLGMRQACVNVSFAFQLFTSVFHALSSWTFNSVVAAGSGNVPPAATKKKRGTLPPGGALWTTRMGAGKLLRRLMRVKQWAVKHGLEESCECYLRLPLETCQLITSDRSKFQVFQRRVLELHALNSSKVEWLLTHLGDPPPVPHEWVNNIVKNVREVTDRELLVKSGSPSSRESKELLSLNESSELQISLIIPPDAYAANSGLIGIPEGFIEAVQPLVEDGCISLRKNEAAFAAPLNGLWTGHFMQQPEKPKAVGFEKQLLLPKRDANNEMQALKSRVIAKNGKLNVPALCEEAGVQLKSVVQVVLKRNGGGLGMSIVAAKPEGDAPYGIYVRQIVAGGAAARSGRLETGDQILAISNSPLINCDQSEAVAILTKTNNDVALVVAKRAAQARGILELIQSGGGGENPAKPVGMRPQLPQLRGGGDGQFHPAMMRPQLPQLRGGDGQFHPAMMRPQLRGGDSQSHPAMMRPQQPQLRGALVNRQANMVRSTPDLNTFVDRQTGYDDDDDDSVDDDENEGHIGSRISQTGARNSRPVQRQQQPIYRPKSMEALASRQRSNPSSRQPSIENISRPNSSTRNQMSSSGPSRKPTRVTSSEDDEDELTSENGSDSVWRPSASNETLQDKALNKTVNDNHQSTGAKFSRKKELSDEHRFTSPDRSTSEEQRYVPEIKTANERGRPTAEHQLYRPDNKRGAVISTTSYGSLTSNDSVIERPTTAVSKKQPEKSQTKPAIAPKPILLHRPRGSFSSCVEEEEEEEEEEELDRVYVNNVSTDSPSSEDALSSESEDIIHDAKERIQSRESLSSTVGSLNASKTKESVGKANSRPRLSSAQMQERISTWEEVEKFKKKTETAEKNTSPPASSLIKTVCVSDKSMQTMIDCVNKSPEKQQPIAENVVTHNSGVQTDSPVVSPRPSKPILAALLQQQDPQTSLPFYRPPLERLPVENPEIQSVHLSVSAGRNLQEGVPVTKTAVVDVTKSSINPQIGRFQQVFSPEPSSSVISPIYDQPINVTSLNLPWGGPYPSQNTFQTSRASSMDTYRDQPGPLYQGYVRNESVTSRAPPTSTNTIQSGVTFWSSQGNLDREDISPPPEPTAEFPQYHPPAFLQPSDWAMARGNQRDFTSPSVVVHGPPAMHSLADPTMRVSSRETSPRRIDVLDYSRPAPARFESPSLRTARASSLNRAPQPHVIADDKLSQSEKLRLLSLKMNQLEAALSATTNPSKELLQELEHVQMEYKFQAQLSERVATRSKSLTRLLKPTEPVKTFAYEVEEKASISPPKMTVASNHHQPQVCPKPLVVPWRTSDSPPIPQKLEELEKERLEVIRIQEQRARIHEEQLKNSQNQSYLPSMNYSQSFDNMGPSPIYENRSEFGQLTRGGELRLSKKSVTFDKQLESVTVYSPPGTPHDSLSSGGLTLGRERSPIEQIPINRQNRFVSQGFVHQVPIPSKSEQLENAECLSFKDKMAYFAQVIGDDLPKSRQKASNKQIQIMHTLTH